jgi:hypothetical protein
MRQGFWVVLGVIASAIFCGLAGGAYWLARRSLRPVSASAPVVYTPAAHPKTAWHGTASGVVEDEEPRIDPDLPPIKRDIPVFQARLLSGCSRTDLDTIETGIHGAIGVGAPLYNKGDFAGCYRTYDSAAQSIERDVGKSCKGPAGALKDGRARAAKRTTPAESAWAMRDAFDGLLDVIDRKGTEL